MQAVTTDSLLRNGEPPPMVHAAILKLGLHCSSGQVSGASSRCLHMLQAFSSLIQVLVTCAHVAFAQACGSALRTGAFHQLPMPCPVSSACMHEAVAQRTCTAQGPTGPCGPCSNQVASSKSSACILQDCQTPAGAVPGPDCPAEHGHPVSGGVPASVGAHGQRHQVPQAAGVFLSISSCLP